MVAFLALTLARFLPPGWPVVQNGSDIVNITLPKDWTRTEASATVRTLTFVRQPTDESGLKLISVFPPFPKVGSLTDTFFATWKTLIQGLSPHEPFERHLVPLLVRNSKGVVVAFDGDILEHQPYRAMLYLVDRGDTVVPILGLFRSDPPIAAISFVSSPNPTELAKTLSDMVDRISLKSGRSAPGPLFKASQLVGSYHQTHVASTARYVDRNTGATVGDASSGVAQDFDFNSDGSYREMSATVIQGKGSGVSTRKGAWKLVGDRVIVHYANAKTPDKKLWLMGIGTNRRGKGTLAYLVDPRYIDKYFFQMFVEGADVSYFYCERKAG